MFLLLWYELFSMSTYYLSNAICLHHNYRMASGSWYKGILLSAVLSCVLHETMADCSANESESGGCDQCYQTLASSLLNTKDNKYHLRKTFFPPDTISPDFVTVTYQFDNTSVPNQTWYWSAGVFYFYQPLRVFQFTSLLFGPPDIPRRNVTLSLPAECENAPEDFMQLLTQTVGIEVYDISQNASIKLNEDGLHG